jgi:serine O-acetyltransferase
MHLDLKESSRADLLDYLTAQLGAFFPDGRGDVRRTLDGDLDEALDRLRRCINAVAMWREDEFHYLHSEQNAVFLYYLANTVWRNRRNDNVCTKLFYLNKALNGFSCFYDNELPERFFVGHSVGIVLVRNRYPEYFAVYQNCTVGRHGDKLPVLEEGLVMYPNSAIVGDCHVRAHTFVAQGTSIINADTPGEAIAFERDGRLDFRPPREDLLGQIFRL